jgi:hypothetical protein
MSRNTEIKMELYALEDHELKVVAGGMFNRSVGSPVSSVNFNAGGSSTTGADLWNMIMDAGGLPGAKIT